MQKSPVALVVFLVGLSALGGTYAEVSRDPFLRVNPSELPRYRAIWSGKLEKTDFDCGRFVSLPAFDPESSISVYSYTTGGRTTGYKVTYISAVDNMWQRSRGISLPAKAEEVKTTRIDAEIPESTALLLRRLWTRILTVSHPTADQTKRDVIPLDTPYFEWSLQTHNGPPPRVQANWYIEVSPVLKQFADIPAVMLAEYCKAGIGRRPRIARRIEKEANRLLQLIQRRGGE